MGGGLLQLVAYGAQDVYLTGNPQITFFKVAYRRHTNFALEAIQQTFNGNPTYGSRVTCQISRNGDLIHRVYLEVTLSDISESGPQYYRNFGLRLLNYVEVEIGGQRIDRHYSHWLYVWNELSLPLSKRRGYNEMVGAYGYKNINKTLYIPLEFWFCRNVGLALPLIALQYHEVKININFETLANCVGNPSVAASFSASLWVDYIYLDTDERRRFAQLSHEYLIEQLQFTGQEAITGTSIKPKLSFNHPCKELVFFISTNTGNNWFNYTTKANATWNNVESYETLRNKLSQTNYDFTSNNTTPSNPIKNAKLVLNGNDRFYERSGRYFNIIQPYQHHENIPANAGINVYSFSLKPEEHQPSGSLNMSRIDTAVLNLNFEEPTGVTTYDATKNNLYVYAVNYNVLRILSGMGGLAYSN
jgi:hypothetical protein